MAKDLPRFLTALVSSREEKSCLDEPFTRSQIVSQLDGPISQSEHQRDNWGYSNEKMQEKRFKMAGEGERNAGERDRIVSYRCIVA